MPGQIRSSFVACPVLLFALLFATSLFAQVKVLKNFTLIDGTGRAPLPNAAMILENGRIAWVGPAAKLKPPPSAPVTDLQGKYIMPGIINLHVHLGATIGLDQNEKFFTPENVEKDLKTYASYGVTTVLITHDMAVARRTRRVIRIRDGLIEADEPNVPQVIS